MLISNEMRSRWASRRSASGTPRWANTSRSMTRMRSDIIEEDAGGAVKIQLRGFIGRKPPIGFGFVIQRDVCACGHGGVVEQKEMGLLIKLGRLDAVLHQ